MSLGLLITLRGRPVPSSRPQNELNDISIDFSLPQIALLLFLVGDVVVVIVVVCLVVFLTSWFYACIFWFPYLWAVHVYFLIFVCWFAWGFCLFS